MEKHISNGSVDMSSQGKIHLAIPNSIAMCCDPAINLDDLHVSYIQGFFSETITNNELEPTRFGKPFQSTSRGKYIKFGKAEPNPLPYAETIELKEFFESEGNFTITKLLVEFLYSSKVVNYGIPQEVTRIIYHTFRPWNFSPIFLAKIFDRVPSHPLYKVIKKQREDWLKRGGDIKAYKRLRSTWLVNKPDKKEDVPFDVYTLWYGKGALVIPERLSDFKGRELGLGFKP